MAGYLKLAKRALWRQPAPRGGGARDDPEYEINEFDEKRSLLAPCAKPARCHTCRALVERVEVEGPAGLLHITPYRCDTCHAPATAACEALMRLRLALARGEGPSDAFARAFDALAELGARGSIGRSFRAEWQDVGHQAVEVLGLRPGFQREYRDLQEKCAAMRPPLLAMPRGGAGTPELAEYRAWVARARLIEDVLSAMEAHDAGDPLPFQAMPSL